MHSVKGFAAIRKGKGEEWLDSSSFGLTEGICRMHLDKTAEEIPGWNALHPVVGIVPVTMTEDA
jgi:hypothetical protein